MDPFGAVLADAEKQLSSAQLVLRQYKNEPTHARLSTLKSLLQDLTGVVKELTDSIVAVQSNPAQFGLDHVEINNRIEQVGRINNQITDIQEALAEVRHPPPPPPQQSSSAAQDTISENPFQAPDEGNSEQDRMLLYQDTIDEQDTILDSVFVTVQNLREQANTMSRELEDQAVMLDDFEVQVDRSEDRLQRARKRVDWVLRNNRDTLGSCCIGLLIVVLVILLVLIIIA